jgi:hypothetical protein
MFFAKKKIILMIFVKNIYVNTIFAIPVSKDAMTVKKLYKDAQNVK